MTSVSTSPAPTTNQTNKERFTSPMKRDKNDIQKKPDFEAIIEGWVPKTDILKRIESNNPERSFKVLITPDMALDMLTLNDMGKNRHIRWKDLQLYMIAMKNGSWLSGNGDTIRFTKKMKLIDGQHRLWAIYLTKKAQEMFIVTGLREEAFGFIDIGNNRNGGDILSTLGYQHHASALSYAIKSILLFERKSIFKGGISQKEVPNSDVLDWAKSDKLRMEALIDDLELISTIWITNFNRKFFTPPQWLAVYYILRTLPNRHKDAKKFLESFASGDDLPKTSPIKVVRNYFESDMEQFTKYKKGKIRQSVLTIKVKALFAAWDKLMAGESISNLTLDLSTLEIKKPSMSKKSGIN